MSVNLESVRAQVRVLVGFTDTAILSNADVDEIISKALARYSRLRSVTKVTAMTGNTTGVHDLPSDFEQGFSQILEVEYPVSQVPKEIIDPSCYIIDRTPTGWVLRFDYDKPTSGEIWWLKYSIAHSLTSDGVLDEMPETDQAGFEYLCSSLTCSKLSNFFASKANPTLPGTELVTYNERVREYADKAAEWYKRFDSEIRPAVTGMIGTLDFESDTYFDRKS